MIQAAIISDRVVTPSGIKKAAVIIKEGKIVDVQTGEFASGDFTTINVGNKVLMAGIVDPHVHINEPGRSDWEGFETATRSAIAGGITTLVDMPLNSNPVTTTAKAFDEKLRHAKAGLHSNCGFWGGIVPGNENEIEPLIKKGILGFKAFLTHSGIDEFPAVTEQDLQKAMPIIASYDLPLLVHCELTAHNSKLPAATRSYANYMLSRPAKWEDDAIALMIRLCRKHRCKTHIVHLSSASSIEQITRAKQEGLPLTVETAQHYLYFNAEKIKDGQTVYKCAPPIREKENNDRLWKALKDGIIDFVATDHSPAPAAMKEPETGDFINAWGGISSLQLALPALWTAAKKHHCSVGDLAKWLCENSSVLPGLQNSKGKIEKGYDADLLVWDPDDKKTITGQSLHHRHKLTPYLGEELYGVVEQTWLAGEKVFHHSGFTFNHGNIILRSQEKAGNK